MQKQEKLLQLIHKLDNHLRFGHEKFQLIPAVKIKQQEKNQPNLKENIPIIEHQESPAQNHQEELKRLITQEAINAHIKLQDLPNDLPEKNLEEIRLTVMQCIRCRLYRGRRRTVFGEGNAASPLMFIGEAPGADEDKEGKPFVGKAGQLLTKMLEAIDINRKDVFITNILKCRPPENRDPLQDEVEACSYYLKKQINLINPRIIVTLGKFATSFILEDKTGIMKLRGKIFEKEGRIIVPILHPSALLHNPQHKRPTWEDLKMLKEILIKINFYQKSDESL